MALLEGISFIAGTTVELKRPVIAGTTEFNEQLSDYESEMVSNVLVAPSSTSDLEAARPNGAKIALTFHFPKTYTQSLKDCLLVYEGREYKVIGDPQAYMQENTPSIWNRAATAEVVDG